MAFGPIDFIALEFNENKFNGEIISDLTELVSSETLRILDLIILEKNDLGEVVVRELQELEPAVQQMLEPLRAEISGMVTVDDIKMIGSKLKNNTTAAVMLLENLWAVRLKQDISFSGGRIVLQEHIPDKVVREALDDLADYE